MKPKERKPQKQTSRMYLRKHDHRDVIFDDKYHNAMWCKTEHIDDELVWTKFPNKALMFANKPVWGWMDVDRQFQYALGAGTGSRSCRLFKLNNGIAFMVDVYTNLASAYIYATDNGVVWKDIKSKFTSVPSFQESVPFGEDSICHFWGDDYWHTGQTKKHIQWTRVTRSEDEDEYDFDVEQKSYTLDCDESWIDWYTPLKYCGTINDTVIVMKEVADNSSNCQQWWFSVNRTGHVEMLSVPVPQVTWMGYTNGVFVQTQQGKGDGARLFFATASAWSHDRYNTWTTQVVAWSSMDGGETWSKEVLYSGNTLPDYDPNQGGIQHRLEMFQRDGEVFLLFGQACNKDGVGYQETHLYSTYTGSQWDEIALPKWIDIPVIHVPSGQCVNPSNKDTLKIAIRPNETSGQDYNMFALLTRLPSASFSMDYDHGNMMWQDGELKDLLDTDFYMVIGWNPMIYFDNRYMAESSKAFAWFTKDYDLQMDGADYVQSGDYCMP